MTDSERARDRAASRRRSGIGARIHSKARTSVVDPVAIDRACAGELVRLNQAEVTLAVEQMRRAGLSIHETALRLRMAPRSVNRHRAKALAA